MRSRPGQGWQKTTGCALLVVFSAVCPVQANAAEPTSNPSLTKTWVIDAGAMFQRLDGGATAELDRGGGGSVGFSQIGLDDRSTSPILAARWRFTDRWRFDFTYDSVIVDGDRTVSRDIDFGFISIPASAPADSALSIRSYSGFGGYSVLEAVL